MSDGNRWAVHAFVGQVPDMTPGLCWARKPMEVHQLRCCWMQLCSAMHHLMQEDRFGRRNDMRLVDRIGL